jgi:hypothetical protein
VTVYGARTQNASQRLASITRAYDGVTEGDRVAWNTPARHKVFVSYHAEDAPEVVDFIEAHTDVFIPRAIGMEEDGSDIIDSADVAYIRQTIKQKYLRDSTVTLVAISACTWARKFVDWEIDSSLRSDPTPNGLLAVQLPSVAETTPELPERLRVNLAPGDEPSYSDYYVPPASHDALREWIETAFNARVVKRDLIDLGGQLRQHNSACSR